MAETQENMAALQEIAPPTLLAVPEVRGTRFHPGYLAPLAAHRFFGSVTLVVADDTPGLLFVSRGTAYSGVSGLFLAGPAVVPLRGPWVSTPGSGGWLTVFRPSVVNQNLACWPGPRRLDDDNIYLDQDQAMLDAVLSPAAPGPFLLSPEEAQYLERLFSSMNDLLGAQADVYWPCRSRSLLLEILYFLWRRPVTADPGPDGSLAQGVHDWLRTHFADRITLSALASRFGTNRTTLQDRFQARYGVSVMDFLRELRVEMACVLARNTALSLAEVSARSGFSDYSSFYREFLRRRGVAPVVYRKTLASVQIY